MRSGLIRLARWRPFGSGRLGRRAAAGLLAIAGMAAAAAASHSQTSVGVLKVRLGGDAAETRIVVELDRPTHGRLLLDGPGDPPRVVLALAHVDAPGEMRGQGAGLVRSWSVVSADGGAELKLDLVRTAHVRRRFLLPPGDGASVYRYVLDLSEEGVPAAAVRTALVERRAPIHIVAPLQPAEPTRKVIVIDAGHGGHDPGAAGYFSHEKDITLATARVLRDRLERTGRYKVVMTRTDDTYIPLETRVRIARRANADLFISLHADSGADPSIRGATVYTLSEQGADRAGRQVFEKADWINVNLPGADASVNRILLDLTQRETRNRSSVFAEDLLDQIGVAVPLLRRSHRDAGFMVLLAPDVPAVLLEMGFITNRADEQELADPSRRQRLASGVAAAIDLYFAHDTQLAAR